MLVTSRTCSRQTLALCLVFWPVVPSSGCQQACGSWVLARSAGFTVGYMLANYPDRCVRTTVFILINFALTFLGGALHGPAVRHPGPSIFVGVGMVAELQHTVSLLVLLHCASYGCGGKQKSEGTLIYG